jgi:hypothetical protein
MGYQGPDDLFQAEYRTLDKHQYVHIFVVGLLFAAFDAYGIGSNDVVRTASAAIPPTGAGGACGLRRSSPSRPQSHGGNRTLSIHPHARLVPLAVE